MARLSSLCSGASLWGRSAGFISLCPTASTLFSQMLAAGRFPFSQKKHLVPESRLFLAIGEGFLVDFCLIVAAFDQVHLDDNTAEWSTVYCVPSAITSRRDAFYILWE